MGPGGGGGRGLKGQQAQPSPCSPAEAGSPVTSAGGSCLRGCKARLGPWRPRLLSCSPGRPCALSHGRLRSLKVRSPACRCNAACGHHSGPRCLGGVRACVPLPPVALGGSFVGHPGPSPHPLPLQHPARLSVLSSPHLEGGREEPGTSRAPDNRPKAWATAATPRSSEKGGGDVFRPRSFAISNPVAVWGGARGPWDVPGAPPGPRTTLAPQPLNGADLVTC